MKWWDTTSYARGDTVRQPRAWTAELCTELSISVLNNHIHYPGRFIMHCPQLGIDTKPLTECITTEQAQEKAVRIVRKKLERMMASLDAQPDSGGGGA